MRVKMLAGLSGTWDGNDWPARGEVADLPAAVAVDLVNAGFAEAVADVVETASAEPAEVAARRGRRAKD